MCISDAESYATGSSQLLVGSPIVDRSQLRCQTKTNHLILDSGRLPDVEDNSLIMMGATSE